MIKTRLLKLLSHARKYVVLQVVWQWISLLCQVLIVWCVTSLMAGAFAASLTPDVTGSQLLLIGIGVALRYAMDRLYSRAGYLASVDVKRVLREKIYAKLLRLGASYREKTASSQVVQMATEGVEQLETYFGKYLSQFFYALLAPLTLFLILMRVSLRAAVVLLVAVPLIPIVIMVVMMVARRLLDRYFNIYYGLGDSFLEKLQGLTTLKVYQADQEAADDMDRESEKFRRITMKVLSMQLNSTAVMDIVAYGGAAVGMVVALQEFYAGNVGLQGALLIILLGAEFFLPMRLLGSYFHIGMNGMKASDRIFEFLDTPEPDLTGRDLPEGPHSLELRDVTFSYDGERQVLDHVSLKASSGSFVSLVGVSGSGKSTIASLLMGKNRSYGGEVLVGGVPLREVSEASLMRRLTLVSHDSYLFEGTVRDNLQMACPAATDAQMNEVLARVQLLGFVTAQGGLEMRLDENAANLSGGQRQRLALARALLHDSDGYIFDEATSNIDMESEEMIMRVVRELARTKTVVLISHRLANVTQSDAIYFLERGTIAEQGTHAQLIARGGSYAKLFASQSALESNAELNAEGEEEAPTAVIASGVRAGEPLPIAEEAAAPLSEPPRADGPSAASTSGVPVANEPASAGRESSSLRRRGGLAIMRRLIVLVRPLAGVMCLGITLGVIGFLCAIFLTVLAGRGVVEGLDIAAGTSGYSGWTALFTAMLVVAFARGFLHYGEQYCNHYIAFRILAIIRHKVFAALRKLCPAKLEGKDKGDLISLITSDIELLEVFYAHTISPIAIAVVVSVVMVAYVGHFNALAGVVAAAGYVTVGVIIPLWNGSRGSQAGLDFRNALGALSSFVLQSLYGLDETIQYGAGEKTLDELDARSRKLANLQKRMSGFEASQRSATNLAIQGFSLLMLLVMLGAYGAGTCGFEPLVLCVIAMMGSFGPVTALSNLSNSLNQTLASGERVLTLLDETPAVEEVEGEQDVAFEGAAVRNVTFSYGGGNNSVAVFPTIDDCSLDFPMGHIIGIHGRSGSGKSTLLKLLMRFWDVQRGSVEISGHDIRHLNTSNLREMEGYVMQDTWLFHDTIARNIAVGKPGASQEEIEDAAKKASIHDFIVSLPQGYQTNVGELGDALSGGERQRIGIARAFLHDADFILLDEPTSNLDALNEGIILRSLKEEAAGRTIALVSHRRSTMAIADTVYEMAGGRPS